MWTSSPMSTSAGGRSCSGGSVCCRSRSMHPTLPQAPAGSRGGVQACPARAGTTPNRSESRHMSSSSVADRTHHRRRFQGRDPTEEHRASTPLELLYDLTIVVAFGTAADELAHFVAEKHVWPGIAGFVFAAFAVSWAWVNYTWFASAYDTDDWVFRLATMVQMVGVVVISLGLPQMFESIDHGG